MPLNLEIDDLDSSLDLLMSDVDVDVETDDDSEFESLLDGDVDFEALGIDPLAPTPAKPGSEEKVIMLAARYSAGVPLWHGSDCYDHGPLHQLTDLD